MLNDSLLPSSPFREPLRRRSVKLSPSYSNSISYLRVAATISNHKFSRPSCAPRATLLLQFYVLHRIYSPSRVVVVLRCVDGIHQRMQLSWIPSTSFPRNGLDLVRNLRIASSVEVAVASDWSAATSGLRRRRRIKIVGVAGFEAKQG